MVVTLILPRCQPWFDCIVQLSSTSMDPVRIPVDSIYIRTSHQPNNLVLNFGPRITQIFIQSIWIRCQRNGESISQQGVVHMLAAIDRLLMNKWGMLVQALEPFHLTIENNLALKDDSALYRRQCCPIFLSIYDYSKVSIPSSDLKWRKLLPFDI